MHEGIAFDPPEHTPKARCEIPIRQIPPCHMRIQRFGGLAGRRDVGGKGGQNNINRRVEEQAGTTKPNSRSHLWRIELRSHSSQYLSEDMATQHDIVFDFALKPRFITAITRQQTQTAKKRVRFADTYDEDSEALPVEPEPPDRPNDATTESSHVEMVKHPLGQPNDRLMLRMLTH
ncbi:unnamed protein product [Phytophthora fragariaefolia]|uniref:Unnamed protein product n=1 Tax=Phytophthora fragariaefolia TaxID=1490495 RepID=A0A9W6X6E5_9STRA|nr:unnamed protein product [Phytophthora fragariaefolia]